MDSSLCSVILASKSPRRRDLLTEAGVNFTVKIPKTPVDETLDTSLCAHPERTVRTLAKRKAEAVVQEMLSEAPFDHRIIVIGADTLVVAQGDIFGKPCSRTDAKRMLQRLSDTTHQVMTGVSVWELPFAAVDDACCKHQTFADITQVSFRSLSEEEISDYLSSGEPFDKAGAYAIQGRAAGFVIGLDGALDTVIGLPVGRLVEMFPELLEQRR